MSAFKARCHQAHILKPTLAIAIFTGVFATAAAYAQTANEPAVTPPSDLEEIIVTAQKRSESLLSVAAPVTALSSEDLARQGDVQLSDYAANVPGLNLLTSQPGQTVVIMRGISTGFGAGIPATTATYINDVPYGSSTSAAYGSIGTLDLDPATLQQIEVLRGPQGTLYGASSLGGLIKYVTRPPSLKDYSGRLEVDGSSVDGGGEGYGVRALVDGPLVTDQLGMTLSAFHRLEPGFINDPHQDKKNVNSSTADGGRFALLWKPTSNFSAELSALFQNNFTDGASTVDVNSNLTPIYGKYEHVRYGDEVWNLRNSLYSLSATYDFGWADLTSITSYSTRNARWGIEESYKFGPGVSSQLGIPDLGLYDDITLSMNKTTQEIRLASPDSNTLEWLAGFYYTHEHSVKPEAFTQPISLVTDMPVPQAYTPGGLYADILHDFYKEYAGYADVTLHLTSSFKILGGLRYASNSETDQIPAFGLLNGGSSEVDGNSSDHSLTYLVSPSYNIDDRNMVYARVASGYRPGGPTNVGAATVAAGAPTAYKPDSLTNYEVGYKASFPQQRMTIDVSGFYIDWKDIQLLTVINGFNVTGNGGTARSDGLEFAWTWQPVDRLKLSANGAYTDAQLTADVPLIGGKSGDSLPDVPKFSGNLGTDYDFPVTRDVNGFVGGNLQYQGKRFVDFVPLPATVTRTEMPAYTTVNVHAGADHGGLTIEAYVKNVTNAYGITRTSSLVINGYGAPLAAAIIQPRTFGLSMSQKF